VREGEGSRPIFELQPRCRESEDRGPFLSFTTKTYTTPSLNTESTYDWNAHKWTVPLNLLVAQLLRIGGQPMQFQIGPKLYVEGPTGAPDWGIRFAYTLLFPTK